MSVLLLAFAALSVAPAAGHVPLFAGLSPSSLRVVDAPKPAEVSQVLYGKLLPGQRLCLRAAGASSAYEADFVAMRGGVFEEGHLAASLGCGGGGSGPNQNHNNNNGTAEAPPQPPPSGCRSEEGEHGHVEPFTQSVHFSLAQSSCRSPLAGGNATSLSGDPLMFQRVCPSGQDVVACIEALPQGPGGVALAGIVIGRGEEFSLADLLSFPLHASRLHGSYGSDDYVLHYAAAALAGLGLVWLVAGGGLSPPGGGFVGGTPEHGLVVRYLLLGAAGVFLVVAADACYHAARRAAEVGLSPGEGGRLALALLLAVGVAQLVPMVMCLRFVHTAFAAPRYCGDILAAALAAGCTVGAHNSNGSLNG